MKRAIRIIAFTAIFFVGMVVAAQTPPDVKIKDTPAAKNLVDLSQKWVKEKSTLDTALQQARTVLDQNITALKSEIVDEQKKLDDELAKDKKYRDQYQHIVDLQKQLADASENAQKKLEATINPVIEQSNFDAIQINVLITVVRQENGLPDTAAYDRQTQKWTITADASKPETKK